MKDLIHKLLDHQIELLRHDAHLRRVVTRKLNKTLKDIAMLAASADKRTLKKILKTIEASINKVYRSIYTESEKDMAALLTAEVAIQQKIFNQHGIAFKIPTHKEIANNAPLINGAGLDAWWAKQSDDVVFRFKRIVRQGVNEEWLNRDISKRLGDEIKIARRHADTLVITATASVSDQAAEILKDKNIDSITGELQVSVLDSRTSEICRGRDGLIWDKKKKPVGHHIAYQRPPLHPRCRSRLMPITKKLPSGKASEDGIVPFDTDYSDWLERKSKAQQNDILGKGKAELWRDGKITLKDMLDQTGRPLSLEEIKRIHRI